MLATTKTCGGGKNVGIGGGHLDLHLVLSPGQSALVPEAATPAAATVASDAAAGAQPVVLVV